MSLQSFLGLASWFSKFIPNYAAMAFPVREILKANMFEWTEDAQETYDKIKSAILQCPALSPYDPELPTFVTSDACHYGIGATLSQIHTLNGGKHERIVAFASRTLSASEQKYSIVEKEALACVFAVERWRIWLWGRRFTLRTDCQALETLLTAKGNSRAGLRITRWSRRLLCFNYDVQYIKGKSNVISDGLSPVPVKAVDIIVQAIYANFGSN